jgi:dihydrofolate synthase/folylpolyglutamate synthase
MIREVARVAPPSFDWLFGLEQFGIKLGLDNITTLLEALGRPERAYRTAHIAGTNGKGSVAAMTDTALRAAGYLTGRYTSPHLVDIAERFAIDGRPVDRDALVVALEDIRATVDHLQQIQQLQVQPTFFEVTTALAFELFRRAGVDVAVCEVGLGGRLDATNVLEPVASAITSIGFDHQQHLGSTLRDIAIEKAGIIKPGTPVVVGRMPAAALNAIEAAASERGAEVIRAWEDVAIDELTTPKTMGDWQEQQGGTRVKLRTPAQDYGDVNVALAGAHQLDNAAVAVRLLETLGARGVPVSKRAIADGLARVSWPGRLESRRLADGRELLFDAAHNLDGAEALARFLAAAPGPVRPLVFAAMRDKDAAGMLSALAPVSGELVLTRASNERSTDPKDLASLARTVAPDSKLSIHASAEDAVAAAWRISSRIVVAGSIFLVGDVMRTIDRS